MGRKTPLIGLLLLFCLLWLSCANPVMPTGGPADKQPPRLLFTNPDTFATGVQTGNLLLTFNEWIDLKNGQREVQISPPQAQPPILTVRGKSVLITLKDSLLPNTTYQINFGSAIRDITEANVSKGLSYVFSTGPVLDSAWIERRLLDSKTGRPLAGAVCMAYRSPITAQNAERRPEFLGYADSSGWVKLNYLPNQDLYLLGLRESAPDFIYNRPGAEWIGFELNPAKPFGSDTLWLFKEEPDSQAIRSATELHGGKWALKLNLPAQSIELLDSPEDLSGMLLERDSGMVDSCVLWLPNTGRMDSLNIALLADNSLLRRTLYPKGMPKPPKPGKPALEGPSSMPWVLSYSRPIVQAYPEQFRLTADSVKIPFNLSLNRGRASIQFEFLPNKTYRLAWDSAAFIDIFAEKALPGELKFDAEADRNFVTWTVLFRSKPNTPRLIWAETKQGLRLPFNMKPDGLSGSLTLPVGEYLLLHTEDENADGRCNPGNWKNKALPEKTYISKKPFLLKPGFDVETVWE